MTDDSETIATTRYEPLGFLSIALVLLTAALWGGTPVAIRYSLEQLPVVAVAAIRFALGAVFMMFWCFWEGSSLRLTRRQLLTVLGAGLLLFVQIALFNLGIALSNASHGSVLINTFVVWVGVIEAVQNRARGISFRKTGGLLLAAAGGIAMLLSVSDATAADSSPERPTLTGDLILLASAAILGVKIIYTQFAVRSVAPGPLIFWHDVIGVILFSAWSLSQEPLPNESLRMETVLALLYQGLLVAGLCFAIQARLLRRHAASDVSVFSCLTPAFGIAFGATFRGDSISTWVIAAGALVCLGVYVVTTERHRVESGRDD